MGSRGQILVTGAGGFVGSRLLPALTRAGFQVSPFSGELLDAAALENELRREAWDQVIHLAGVSHIPTCEKDPAQANTVNVAGTALLLESLLRHRPEARLTFASTAQVYAPVAGNGETAITEQHPIKPQNVYARTKRAGELLVQDACARGELRATVFRVFNHSHKTQPPTFFLPHLYASLGQAKAGGSTEIPVGNLDLYRDIGSVDDLIAAFVAVAQKRAELDPFEIFNVCSGVGRHLKALAEGMAARMKVAACFKLDPARVRPGEPRAAVGSNERLRQRTGWAPTVGDDASFLDAFFAD